MHLRGIFSHSKGGNRNPWYLWSLRTCKTSTKHSQPQKKTFQTTNRRVHPQQLMVSTRIFETSTPRFHQRIYRNQKPGKMIRKNTLNHFEGRSLARRNITKHDKHLRKNAKTCQTNAKHHPINSNTRMRKHSFKPKSGRASTLPGLLLWASEN